MSDYAQVQTPSGGGRKVVEAVVELLEQMPAKDVGAIMAVSLVGGTAGPSICGTLAATGLRNIFWVPMLSALAVALLTILITRQPPADITLD